MVFGAASEPIQRHWDYMLSMQSIARAIHAHSGAAPETEARRGGGAAAAADLVRAFFRQPAMVIVGAQRVLAHPGHAAQLALMVDMLRAPRSRKRGKGARRVRFGRARVGARRLSAAAAPAGARRAKRRRKTPCTSKNRA